jgi:hypothetical protein
VNGSKIFNPITYTHLPISNMKKLLFAFVIIMLFESCFIIHKEPKRGCPVAAIGAEKMAHPDKKTLKLIKKHNRRSKKKSY